MPVSNSIKYSGKKIIVIICIIGSEEENQIIYYVKGNGSGFDMKYAKKLFGVFQRLRKSSEFEGVGIGLANISRIISRHGGKCRAKAEPGVGAEFYFSLPKPNNYSKKRSRVALKENIPATR
ncbi:MAG: hypothetical protein H6538_08605 [Bacteroidales bacterium]|nr:hypothetical protein [Bacteroidales bacterium]MCB9013847.1 hypothetical protein [Bacteroidales bacterium]